MNVSFIAEWNRQIRMKHCEHQIPNRPKSSIHNINRQKPTQWTRILSPDLNHFHILNNPLSQNLQLKQRCTNFPNLKLTTLEITPQVPHSSHIFPHRNSNKTRSERFPEEPKIINPSQAPNDSILVAQRSPATWNPQKSMLQTESQFPARSRGSRNCSAAARKFPCTH